MRGIQFLGIYLMVTLATLDRVLFYMRLMAKYHLTHGRRDIYFHWYLHAVRSGGHAGGKKEDD